MVLGLEPRNAIEMVRFLACLLVNHCSSRTDATKTNPLMYFHPIMYFILIVCSPIICYYSLGRCHKGHVAEEQRGKLSVAPVAASHEPS